MAETNYLHRPITFTPFVRAKRDSPGLCSKKLLRILREAKTRHPGSTAKIRPIRVIRVQKLLRIL
ncbi:MAG: hypothetical protein ACI4UN_04445, partial [Muribaculaceae bacterium]